MAASTSQTLKTSLALIGLLGAAAFTFLQIFGDSGSRKSSPVAVEESRRSLEATAVEAKPVEAEKPAEKKPKSLTWDDYLRYDPFEGRGRPTEEIVALAAGPSPFFAETIVASNASGRATSNPVDKLSLSAILGSASGRIAVIDNRPYRVGEYLQAKDGGRLEDVEFGSMKVTRIEGDKIEILTGGVSFLLKLSAEEQALVRGAEESMPAKKSKD